LTKNLYARADFADHSAEEALIVIEANDVDIDLGGHTLSSGRIFTPKLTSGIQIFKQSNNIAISNGVLRELNSGIYRGVRYGAREEKPLYDLKTNTYAIADGNIRIYNVTLRNNKRDFYIHTLD
jgi:hypothetical protein